MCVKVLCHGVLCRQEAAANTVLTSPGTVTMTMPVSRSKGMGAEFKKPPWL